MKNDVFGQPLFFSYNIRYVVGVSTGVDSMVLCEYLYQGGYHFHVVHINHHTREATKEEETYIRMYCEARSIPCSIFDYEHKGGNFQNEAREFRYACFEEIAQLYTVEPTEILTAHHFDDVIETYIAGLVRVSPLQTFGIFKVKSYSKDGKRYTLRRPFYNVRKQQLYAYAQEYKLQYYEDASNQDTKYLRNAIRNEVMPALESLENTSIHQVMHHLEVHNASAQYFQIQVENFYASAIQQPSSSYDRSGRKRFEGVGYPLTYTSFQKCLKEDMKSSSQYLSRIMYDSYGQIYPILRQYFVQYCLEQEGRRKAYHHLQALEHLFEEGTSFKYAISREIRVRYHEEMFYIERLQ